MHSPVTAVARSENAKLGNVAATYASQASCPKDCPFYKQGCYAEQGPAGYTTARLNRSEETDAREIARKEARAIDALPGDRFLRLHVVGDAKTSSAARELARAAARYGERGMRPDNGKKTWTYTHAWQRVDRADWGSAVSVLASCESADAARAAMGRGYAAAVVVDEFRQDSAYVVDGLKVIPCPAQTRGVTCEDCGLCRDGGKLLDNGTAIAFEAHGARKGAVRKTLVSLSVVF